MKLKGLRAECGGSDATIHVNGGVGREWTSWESLQCWNALGAMWAAREFTYCLKPIGTIPRPEEDSVVEIVLLNWDGEKGKFFSPWNEATPAPCVTIPRPADGSWDCNRDREEPIAGPTVREADRPKVRA